MPRPRFTPAWVMAAVAVLTLGLAWRPQLFLLALSAPAVFASAKYGLPRLPDGMLVVTPLALWTVFLAVVLPLAHSRGGCAGWGLEFTYCFYSIPTMLACEAVALWRCLRGASLMLAAAVALNWSWLFYWVGFTYGWGPVGL